ncbi:ankyrin [Penicillium malachiteum]|uniref:ankyrin n=1 Tax=Penicillium malachiteum TaxID=1324776 RepID=UPI002546A87B|nr:ankyrin [Penicillium malachiteum]KAJ5729260.1 ankyrin [Penicillium malachiteum]
MASISDLPLELLLFIARFSDYEYDICALSQTNRRLHFLLSPEVYRRLRETPNPALEWAAENGKKDCVRRLLDAGVPPDMNHIRNAKPIILASVHGYTDVVKCFIQNGVDPNSMTLLGPKYLEPPPDKQKYSTLINPLGAACGGDHEQVVQLLIDHGVEAQPSSDPFETKQHLCLATSNENLPIVRILLDHGADPTIKDLRGFNALEYAACLDLEFTLLLLERIPIDHLLRDYRLPRGPVQYAWRTGNIPVLKFWLDLTLKHLNKLGREFFYHFVKEPDLYQDQPATKLFLSSIDMDSILQEVPNSQANIPDVNFELGSISKVLPDFARKVLEKNTLDQAMNDEIFRDAAMHGRIHVMNVPTAHRVNGEKYHREPIGLYRLDYLWPSEPGAIASVKWLVENDTGPYEIHSENALRVLLCVGDTAMLRKFLDTWDISEETKLRKISDSIYLAIQREANTMFYFCLELGVKLNPRDSSHYEAFKESVRIGAITIIKHFWMQDSMLTGNIILPMTLNIQCGIVSLATITALCIMRSLKMTSRYPSRRRPFYWSTGQTWSKTRRPGVLISSRTLMRWPRRNREHVFFILSKRAKKRRGTQ